MNAKQLSLDVRALQDGEAPGFKLESAITYFQGPSYTVWVSALTWRDFPSNPSINYPSCDSRSLVKYTKEEHSPVSPRPSDYIQLGTASYYRNFESRENSELIVDDFDSAMEEELDWPRQGSMAMESAKAKALKRCPELKHYLRGRVKYVLQDYWMYCTSIEATECYQSGVRDQSLFPSYNFKTRIEDASAFAQQLGSDFGRQVDFKNHVKAEIPAYHTLAAALAKDGGIAGEFSIFVHHGPVLYLAKNKIAQYVNGIPNDGGQSILPFVKRTEYREQQEYRFAIMLNYHTPKNRAFRLTVSAGLRNLMAPVEGIG